jgi:uncharacterized protein (TIGR03083 family)
MSMREIDAFAREAERIAHTLQRIGPGDWDRPGLGEWTLAELVFHLVRQAEHLTAYRDHPLSAETATVDRFTYYRGAADLADLIATKAREGAAQVDPTHLAERFGEAWRQSVASATTAGALLETSRGPMRTDEFAATRVLELVVHHMDVRRALDLPSDADPVAAKLTADLLEGMLDGDRPRNLGRTRFILAATGRTPSDDPRFPLLS